MPSETLIKAIAVTAELCGRTFSPEAAAVFVGDLSGYPEDQIMGALVRCRKEVRGILTISDVISRIDDGRPGVEEAWAMIPTSEDHSVVWTEEMAQAFGVCGPLMDSDKVAARMAFKEAYTRFVSEAKDSCKAVKWTPSLGADPRGRDAALQKAIERGRLAIEFAAPMMLTPPPEIMAKLASLSLNRLRVSPTTQETPQA